jgi:cytochrome c oxidase accessory protein FixG
VETRIDESAAGVKADGGESRPRVEGKAAGAMSEAVVLSTLNEDGSRKWLNPKLSPGRWWTRRRLVAYFLIGLFAAIPHITINGHPMILLEVATRRFYLLGHTFLPTDTILLALLMVGVFLSIFLITALAGRLWCGWACPQTVYLEFLYRPIERFFDGAPGRAKKGPFQGRPLGKALKYVVFLAISAFLAHTFLAYFVGVEQLSHWVTGSPADHVGPFLVMAITTGLMMFDFGFFREQLCLVACPYGRFQSVLLDRNSLIVSYDARRGEPRGKGAKRDLSLKVVGEQRGDCVDCGLCVATCPTGIDIRNGLQMECIHCTQCIDACDTVMAKLSRPLGLIRYSSQSVMQGERKRFWRPRVVLYPIVLTLVVAGFLVAFQTKSSADFQVFRMRGATYIPLPGGEVANNTEIKIVNRTSEPKNYTISIDGPAGSRVQMQQGEIRIGSAEEMKIPTLLIAPASAFAAGKGGIDVKVRLSEGATVIKSKTYRLMGPGTTHHAEEENEHGEKDQHGDQTKPADHEEKH